MTERGPEAPPPARPLAAPPRSPHAEAGGGTPRLTEEAAPPGRSLYLPCPPWRAGGSAAAAGSEAGRAGRAGRGGRAVPALAAPSPPAAAPAIVSCPRCVRLPAPRTPSRANAGQSAPAAGRRQPIAGGQGGGDGSARGGHVGGLPLGAAIFRSAPSALLKGPRPALRGGRCGVRSRSLGPGSSSPIPVPDWEEPGVAAPSGHHSRGQSVSGRDRTGPDRCVCGPRPPCRAALAPSGILGVLLIL